MGLLLMVAFFVPGTLLFLFFITTELVHRDYSQATAYAFPLLIFLCGMFAFWENKTVSRQLRDKRQNRLAYLTQLTDEVAGQVLVNPEATKIEAFLCGKFLSHRETLYVMYVGWQKALDELMHNPTLPPEQRRNAMRNMMKNRRYQELMTVHAHEVKSVITGFEEIYNQARVEGDIDDLPPLPDKSLRQSFDDFMAKQFGRMPLSPNQTLPQHWQHPKPYTG